MALSRKFVQRLITWYEKHGRSFPWRETHDPYKILVSEVLLQRTRGETVRKFYKKFLKAYPTVKDLSKAKVSDVKCLIGPLGLAYRAHRLIKIAKYIDNRCSGTVPDSLNELLKLPGVGHYMAQAIACFAFNQPVPLVDANVMRVLGRSFGIKSETIARGIILDAMPRDRFKEFNWGLIDLGALVCSSSSPKCDDCPLEPTCGKHPIKPDEWKFLRKVKGGKLREQ